MPTPTYTPLASVTLSAATSSVTFSGIPQSGYRDLVLVIDGQHNNTLGRNYAIRINGDTGNNYPRVAMFGDGSSAGSNSATLSYINIGYGTEGNSNHIIHFLDASATDKHKTVLSRKNQATGSTFGNTMATAGRWANTNAISSLTCFIAEGDNWVSGTTFNLYGIAG